MHKLCFHVFAFLGTMLVVQPALPGSQQRSAQFTQNKEIDTSQLIGESGLWVRQAQDRIEVHWITARADSGFLRAYHKDKQLFHLVTPESQQHQVVFEAPDMPVLTLRYGSLNKQSDHHETEIGLSFRRPKAIYGKVDSVYALGDIHGRFDDLVKLLQNARLIDANLDWTGGKKHVVFLGDLFDRGTQVTRLLWFLYRLESQAETTGGRIHVVLGNHEIMTFGDDLRYLSPQEKQINDLHGTSYSEMYNVHRSLLGKWLATKPGLIRIDKALYAHGGMPELYSGYSIEAFNDSLQKFLTEDTFTFLLQDSIPIDTLLFYRRQHFFYADNNVFWYRDYVMSDTLAKDLNKVLRRYGSKMHVVAHTPVETISEFYDGKLIAVDLRKPATEMLLLVRKGNKRFKIRQDGSLEKL